jgi:hypothetical protein
VFARMQRAMMIFQVLLFFSLPMICFAQDALPEVPTQDFIGFLLLSIGGLKGAGTLAIVGTAVQILLKFLATPLCGQLFKNLSGAWKLTIVSFLSMVGGITSLMMTSNLTLGAALFHSATLTAFMVFANQVYKQFIEKQA